MTKPGEDVEPSKKPSLVLTILASSRFFVAIAVLGTFLSSVTLLVYGTLTAAELVWDTVDGNGVDVDGAEHLAVEFIKLTDVFLLGTVLYIVALGLYELFIEPDLPLPPWLQIRDLDELKAKMIGVIVVLLGVTFLAFVVDWEGDSSILHLGAAIALVIAALALMLVVSTRTHGGDPPHRDG